MADTQTTSVRRRSATLLQPRLARDARVTITEQGRALDEKIVEIVRPIALPVAKPAGGAVPLVRRAQGGARVTGHESGLRHDSLVDPGNVEFLPALAMHLTGTFLTFVMLPGLMFRHSDPFLLTADGDFVVKNIVLISAVERPLRDDPRTRSEFLALAATTRSA